jgi:CubicO group peptidase (beta-lactamase class C family)
MSSLLRTGLVFTILVTRLVACATRTPQDRAAQIDAYLTQLARDQTFSGSVLVAQEGEILLSKGYGLADVEKQLPNTPQTRYRIHWITMPFTAMAILMLQAEGKLHVRDAICQYIAECPDYWQGITIHHLLTHTSGLSDWIQPWDSTTGWPSTSGQLVAQLKGKPPTFGPGEQLRYCDNGYIVLGHILEQASGQSWETFLQQRIFDPLGMADSGYHGGGIAVGQRTIGTRAPEPDLLFRYSASGLYSTVEDLYLWDRALDGDQLIPKEYLDMMFTGYARTPSVDIKEADYGYGWFIGKVLDRPVIAHGGGMPGFSSMFLRFPHEHLTIIVLRNYEMQIYDRLEIELASMVFGEE